MPETSQPDAASFRRLRQWTAVLRRPLLLIASVFLAGYAITRLLKAIGVDVAPTDVAQLARDLRAWGPWSAAASIGLMILHSALPLPGEIIAIANGLIFGPLPGAALTWIGAMLGAVAAYTAARHLGRAGVSLPLDPRQRDRLQRACTRSTTLLALRLTPVVSFNLINYAAGLFGVGWWRFLWTTSVGILPMTLGASYFGRAMLDAPAWAWIALAVALALSPAIVSALLRRPSP